MKLTKSHWVITAAVTGSVMLGASAIKIYAADNHEDTPQTRRAMLMQQLADTPLGEFLGKRQGKGQELQKQLNLTSEQKTAIKDTLKEHRNELITAIKPVVNARRALRQDVLADQPDESAIRADAEKLGKVMGDSAVTMSRVIADIKTKVHLTPEQEKTLKDFRAERDSDIDGLLNQSR